MIAYICKNCHLHGVGVPNRIFCPNCGKELFVQTHYKGEGADFYDGTYEKVDEVRGLDVVICTTAKTDEEAKFLLTSFNVPYKK